MITAGMRSCVITLQFSLVVLLCVALSLAFEHSAGQVPGGGDLWAVAMVPPFCLHFAHTRLLIVCFAVNCHVPSILNIASRQVNF